MLTVSIKKKKNLKDMPYESKVCILRCVCVEKGPLSVCVGRQRSCSRPSRRATSSSESARAESATHSRTGEYFCRIEGALFQSCGLKSCWAHSLSLALPPQCRWTLQTFHDWCTGGWPVHDSGWEQASPESAGPGGISSQDSHHALWSGSDCCVWTGEKKKKKTQADAKHFHLYCSHLVFKNPNNINEHVLSFCFCVILCKPSNSNADYAQLLFTPRDLATNTGSPTKDPPQPNLNQSHPEPLDEIPPALPYRPNNLTDSTTLLPNSNPSGLYPTLEVELHHVPSPSPASVIWPFILMKILICTDQSVPITAVLKRLAQGFWEQMQKDAKH